jgi:hypothetical protein
MKTLRSKCPQGINSLEGETYLGLFSEYHSFVIHPSPVLSKFTLKENCCFYKMNNEALLTLFYFGFPWLKKERKFRPLVGPTFTRVIE